MAEFALVQAAIRTTAGTQDFTSSGFGTPKGAILFITNGTANGTVVSHAILGIGFTDGTRTVSGGWHSKDAVTTTVTGRIATTARLLTVLDQDAATLIQASFDSWITNGIRINVTTAPASGYLVTVILIGGAGVSNVYANSVTTPSTIDTSTNITAIGFQPDVLFTFDIGRTVFNDANATGNRCGFGVVVRAAAGNPHPQMTHGFSDGNGVTTADVRGFLDTDRAMHDGTTATATAVEFADFAESSPYLKAYLRDLTGTASVVGYIAIKLNGLSAKAMTVDSPVSTGSQSITGIGFTPQFGLLLQTALIANDTLTSTGGNMEVVGISAFTSASQYSVAMTSDDAVTTTRAESVTHSKPVFLRKDGSTFMDASFTSFSNGAATFDYTTANGTARKWIALFVEASDVSLTADSGGYSLSGIATVLRNTAITWLRLRK